MEQTQGKKKAKVCLDFNRPSHGRTWGDARMGYRPRAHTTGWIKGIVANAENR
jgi:hypothetical protein